MNYPDSKDKKKQKKKPIKKVPNSNPSTLIEPSQQRVAFSNNRVHPQRARRFTMSSGGSNPSTIRERNLNRNQNNNNAGRMTQDLGMHTIVEADIERILSGNGIDFLESIPGVQNSALVRQIAQMTEPQRDVTVIPIENDTNNVRTSNRTHFINRPPSERSNGENVCCLVMCVFLVLFFVSLFVGLQLHFRKPAKVSKLSEVSNSTNDLWADDHDSYYDIAPQKVR